MTSCRDVWGQGPLRKSSRSLGHWSDLFFRGVFLENESIWLGYFLSFSTAGRRLWLISKLCLQAAVSRPILGGMLPDSMLDFNEARLWLARMLNMFHSPKRFHDYLLSRFATWRGISMLFVVQWSGYGWCNPTFPFCGNCRFEEKNYVPLHCFFRRFLSISPLVPTTDTPLETSLLDPLYWCLLHGFQVYTDAKCRRDDC